MADTCIQQKNWYYVKPNLTVHSMWGRKKRKIKQILSDTKNNNSLFAIRYKQEYREKLSIIMQLLITVRYMGVLGKCKAKKSRDFSKHFKSSANKIQG